MRKTFRARKELTFWNLERLQLTEQKTCVCGAEPADEFGTWCSACPTLFALLKRGDRFFVNDRFTPFEVLRVADLESDDADDHTITAMAWAQDLGDDDDFIVIWKINPLEGVMWQARSASGSRCVLPLFQFSNDTLRADNEKA